MKACRECGERFAPTPNQIRKHDWLCVDCRRAYGRSYEAKRKAEGRPIKHGRWSREKMREFRKEYTHRPGVRERWREKARERRSCPEELFKISVRRKARTAIEAGLLVRQPCEKCGDSPAHAHHDDYGKPLEVRWLCPVHHTEHHAKARGEA